MRCNALESNDLVEIVQKPTQPYYSKSFPQKTIRCKALDSYDNTTTNHYHNFVFNHYKTSTSYVKCSPPPNLQLDRGKVA